jgi:hypothetical protein
LVLTPPLSLVEFSFDDASSAFAGVLAERFLPKKYNLFSLLGFKGDRQNGKWPTSKKSTQT